MTEPRPYMMIAMAVFGLLSVFIYAREPSTQTDVAQNPAVAIPIYPQVAGQQFPALAGGPTQPVPTAGTVEPLPRFVPPPAAPIVNAPPPVVPPQSTFTAVPGAGRVAGSMPGGMPVQTAVPPH